MEKSKVKFNYKYGKNYFLSSSTDALGGINAKGNFVMNFYNEFPTIPKSVTQEMGEKGILKDEQKSSYEELGEDEESETLLIDRVIDSTLIMQPGNALNLAFWIMDVVANNEDLKIDKEELNKRFKELIGIKDE